MSTVPETTSASSADTQSAPELGIGKRVVSWTRFIVVLPVIGLFFSSVLLVILATVDAFKIFLNLFTEEWSIKIILVDFIELADVYLLAIVLYIISLGLYELFIDDRLPLPGWLEFHHLDDLEEKLIGVVVVVLSVFFLGQVIKSPLENSMNILFLGAGIGILIASIGVFWWAASVVKKSHSAE